MLFFRKLLKRFKCVSRHKGKKSVQVDEGDRLVSGFLTNPKLSGLPCGSASSVENDLPGISSEPLEGFSTHGTISVPTDPTPEDITQSSPPEVDETSGNAVSDQFGNEMPTLDFFGMGKPDEEIDGESLGGFDEEEELEALQEVEGDAQEHFSEEGGSSATETPPTSESEPDEREKSTEATKALGEDWPTIRSVPILRFKKVLWECLANGETFSGDDFEEVNTFQGGFKLIRMIKVISGPKQGSTYAIKIPGIGVESRWKWQDAEMFRSQIGTMKLLRDTTKISIPEVFTWDDGFQNELGAPFMIMQCMSGVTANHIWYNLNEDGEIMDEDVDMPTPEQTTKREVFLRSLACRMSELQSLEFDKTGVLRFKNPDSGHYEVGSSWSWTKIDDGASRHYLNSSEMLKETPTFASTKDYFAHGFNHVFPNKEYDAPLRLVVRRFFNIILASDPFTSSTKDGDEDETFILRHDDLGLQNILCDPATGEVTGILDWDSAKIVPRCVGYSSAPVFLKRDWFPEYTLGKGHMPWKLEEYRETFAGAMIEATGQDGDGKFSMKSAMYQSIHAALFGDSSGSDPHDVLKKLLQQVPGMSHLGLENRDNYLTFRQRMAAGWPSMEKKIAEELPKILAP
ncbi:hypothetical protein BDV96DRAFT_576545 [Lophiotrema nucula]|uniref:Uncharacterized protein n=1 Tax=Lophiotrema nucula TaxID=690887 RepID=A0A6A5Z6T6_9PLEO|nr:hypothetical protein BDV96DRAFT_576545 [Lophiotrema nucula]